MLKNSPTQLQLLLTEAEKFLNQQALDIAHGLDHHHQVWENVQKIGQDIEEQFQKNIDWTALQIAAMWHDITTHKTRLSPVRKNKAKKDTAQYVGKKMADLGFKQSTINKTQLAILQHSIFNHQTILESQIIADADLLEWLNPERFLKTLEIYTTGKFTKLKKFLLKKFSHKWLPQLPTHIHFEITQKIYQEKIILIKENSQIQNLVKQHFNQPIEKLI